MINMSAAKNDQLTALQPTQIATQVAEELQLITQFLYVLKRALRIIPNWQTKFDHPSITAQYVKLNEINQTY